MKLNNRYKKVLATTIASLALATASVQIGPDHASAASKFKDVKPGAFYEQAVEVLSNKGVIGGYEDGTFQPNKSVTRAEAAKMLAYDLGLTDNPASSKFKDVKSGDWFFQPVTALAQAGGISGYEDQTFKPNQTITRAEIASMLVKAYSLTNETSTTSNPFKDVAAGSWYASAVQTLYANKITSGKSADEFAPDAQVTRGEIAAFINNVNGSNSGKSENNQNESTEQEDNTQEQNVIEAVSDDHTVTVGEQTFEVAEDLTGLFNADNQAILKNATIEFEEKAGIITKVTYLQLNASGSHATPEFSGNLELDGQDSEIDGVLQVNANYITLKNLTVNGDLEITSKLANDFYAENLTVTGETIVKGGDSNTVVFKNSKLEAVQVQKQGVRVEAAGSTSVKEVNISTDSTLSVEDSASISKVSIKDGAKEVELDGEIKAVEIASKEAVELTGKAEIDELQVKNEGSHIIGIKETIKLVKVDEDTKIKVGTDTYIKNLQFNDNIELKDILSNYENAIKNIEELNGKDNPDYEAPRRGGGGGGGGGTAPTGGAGGSTGGDGTTTPEKPAVDEIIDYKPNLNGLTPEQQEEFNNIKNKAKEEYNRTGTVSIGSMLEAVQFINEIDDADLSLSEITKQLTENDLTIEDAIDQVVNNKDKYQNYLP